MTSTKKEKLRICTKCGARKPIEEFHRHIKSSTGRRSYCAVCSKKYNKEYNTKNTEAVRRSGRDHYRRNSEKKREYRRAYHIADPRISTAHNGVRKALKEGVLIKGPCVICGNTNTHGHHKDYNKPLEVIWMCRSCHMLHERSLERGNVGLL